MTFQNKSQKQTDEQKMLAVESNPTLEYLAENEHAFSLDRYAHPINYKPRKVEINSLRWIAWSMLKELALGSMRYAKELTLGAKEIKKLSAIRNSASKRTALVIGNGPSQGLLHSDTLRRFSERGDVFVVNFWTENRKLSGVIPNYIIISDGLTLNKEIKSDQNSAIIERNEKLESYLLKNDSIIIFAPINRVRQLKITYGETRVIGFVDTEFRWLGKNIDPRFPRGYLSMTLYKALAIAIHMSYEKIYTIGMDNTYPRDIYVNHENKIFTLERHADSNSYLFDQSRLMPSIDVWAQDLFFNFHDLRKCFQGRQIVNLDCYSLTDAFPKVVKHDQIDAILAAHG